MRRLLRGELEEKSKMVHDGLPESTSADLGQAERLAVLAGKIDERP